MSTKKSTSNRRRVRRSEPTVTATERDEAIRMLLEDGQIDTVCQMHFCENDRALPIVGTPRPRPCPFCGSDKNVHLIIRDEVDSEKKRYTAIDVECLVCGAKIPGSTTNDEGVNSQYEAVLAAARVWNERKGGAA